jgi:hypothetical protein
MEISFCKPEISTISFNTIYNDGINLNDLYNRLEIKPPVTYVSYNENSISLEKGRKVNSGSTKKFKNTCKIEINLNEHVIDVKIYKNGKVNISGIRNFRLKDTIIEIVQKLVRKFDSELVCYLLAYFVKLKEKIHINLMKLFKLITDLDNPKLICIYENTCRKQLNFKYIDENHSTTFTIFTTGTIKVTGKPLKNDLFFGYKFITNFIKKYIDHIMIKDNIQKSISMLREGGYKQRTVPWFNLRKKTITASETGNVLFGEIDTYITGKLYGGSISNDAIEHGIAFEPIAQQIYVRKTRDKNMSTILYETGSHSRGIMSASPDGIIFKFNKSIHYNTKYKISELIEESYNKNIIDSYLLEIKCPYKYTKITNLKLDKPRYYSQVQTQLYVTKMTHCVFFNAEFIEYDNIIDVPNDVPAGVFYKISTHNGYEYVYPDNVSSFSKLSLNSKLNYRNRQLQKKAIFWSLGRYTIQTILRDKEWFSDKISQFKDVHKQVTLGSALFEEDDFK